MAQIFWKTFTDAEFSGPIQLTNFEVASTCKLLEHWITVLDVFTGNVIWREIGANFQKGVFKRWKDWISSYSCKQKRKTANSILIVEFMIRWLINFRLGLLFVCAIASKAIRLQRQHNERNKGRRCLGKMVNITWLVLHWIRLLSNSMRLGDVHSSWYFKSRLFGLL